MKTNPEIRVDVTSNANKCPVTPGRSFGKRGTAGGNVEEQSKDLLKDYACGKQNTVSSLFYSCLVSPGIFNHATAH